MDKSNAKDFLPLVQALAEGKTIQQRTGSGCAWHDVTSVSFGGDPTNYRIKPEPAAVWVLYNKQNRLRGTFESAAEAARFAARFSEYVTDCRIVKFVEEYKP